MEGAYPAMFTVWSFPSGLLQASYCEGRKATAGGADHSAGGRLPAAAEAYWRQEAVPIVKTVYD